MSTECVNESFRGLKNATRVHPCLRTVLVLNRGRLTVVASRGSQSLREAEDGCVMHIGSIVPNSAIRPGTVQVTTVLGRETESLMVRPCHRPLECLVR
jgi:hypothetical protein